MRCFSQLCLLTTLLLMNGCSRRYCCELHCVVLDAKTRKPIEGAKLFIDLFGQKDPAQINWPVERKTAKDGGCVLRFGVGTYDFNHGMPRWYLKIEKDGYVTEVVDVSPRGKPISYSEKSPLVVFAVVNLQPVK